LKKLNKKGSKQRKTHIKTENGHAKKALLKTSFCEESHSILPQKTTKNKSGGGPKSPFFTPPKKF